jgi:hypothetical protein
VRLIPRRRLPRLTLVADTPVTPTELASPSENTSQSVGTEGCERYAQGGRPDLALICRTFGNGTRTNKMRKCLLDRFLIPSDGRGGHGRGGYVDSDRITVWGMLGPIVGPSVHVNCFEESYLN